MATRSTYVVQFRRKREGKTDYKQRLKLLLSEKPRIVVRKSKKHLIIQLIEYASKGDKVITTTHTSELEKFGYKGDTNNIPAAYLCGLLAGKKSLTNKIKEAVPDLGLQHPIKGSKIYAALKGAKDAGIKVALDDSAVPKEERILGKHIAAYAEKLKSNEKYNKMFSSYLKRQLKPEQLAANVESTKQTILK